MATINPHRSKDGTLTYRVRVRMRGQPLQTASFPSLKDARKWATMGRRFQLGEGWHSSENTVRFWTPSPRVPKEAEVRCDAFTTAYATMIPLGNGF
jgi:hypothetical protein